MPIKGNADFLNEISKFLRVLIVSPGLLNLKAQPKGNALARLKPARTLGARFLTGENNSCSGQVFNSKLGYFATEHNYGVRSQAAATKIENYAHALTF